MSAIQAQQFSGCVMALYKNGQFCEDSWRLISEGEDIAPSGHVIVPLDWWRVERAIFDGSHVPLGLMLEPDARLHDLENDFAHDLARFALIAIHFPRFGDGRGYTLARLLRERYKFRGELRACGDVLIDQIQIMSRCGFDAFDIRDDATQKALRRGHLPGVFHFYQPASTTEIPQGTRSWARRPI
jgi:uncharacterized protein (DUF934 family)